MTKHLLLKFAALTLSETDPHRSRADMLNSAAVDWAEAVLDSFEDPARAVRLGAYHDNLHPSRVETYASNLMKYTTEG